MTGELLDDGDSARPGRFYFEGVESPNGTIFPDVLLDRVMAHLTGAEFKVLAYIVRRTFGFKKDSDTISLDQICNGIKRRDGSVLDEGTGLARKTAVAAIHGLEVKGVIVCQRRSSPDKGNLPTSFALRFKGQPATTPDTNSHQGGREITPGGATAGYQPGSLPSPGLGTIRHPQSTVEQPTASQEDVRGKQELSTAPGQPSPRSPSTVPAADLAAVWSAVLARLASQVGDVSYRTWLAPTRLRQLDATVATVEVPHSLAERWIGRHFADAIRAELRAVTGQPFALRLEPATGAGTVRPAPVPSPPEGKPEQPPAAPDVSPTPRPRSALVRRVRPARPS